MQRRSFLQLPVLPAVALAADSTPPQYAVVTPYQAARPDPNKYPGRVIASDVTASPESVRRAIAAQMKALTGASDDRDAWRAFFTPADVVGIKVNCSGAPRMMSHPLVVAEVARCLTVAGVKAENIYVYERFRDQMQDAGYEAVIPAGAKIHAMEPGDRRRANLAGYDQRAFVEADFFGEDQTRSFLSRAVTRLFTKIVNIPNMKDHGAAGVTGCLKNIAYGGFSNVARSHRDEITNTLTFIGTLYNTEPLRSKTVLHIMDGIQGVWEGGPFLQKPEYRFEPKRMMVGTDPVAMDRLLLDIIEAERQRRGWPSVWDRSPEAMKRQRFRREPGHIAYAGSLGLGVADKASIQLREVSA
jgi:uncharacterized protein (DUF362 family)